jgi:hypothetical protein
MQFERACDEEVKNIFVLHPTEKAEGQNRGIEERY